MLVCGVYVRWIREKVIVAYSQIIFRHLKNVQGGARNVIPLIVQGPHSEVVPRAFWRLVSKSCDECKGSFARGCEAKRWSHWTCSSLGTIFQPVRINSVTDAKCFCNNKNVLRAQSLVWHFVCHPVLLIQVSRIILTIHRQWIILLQNSSSYCSGKQQHCVIAPRFIK